MKKHVIWLTGLGSFLPITLYILNIIIFMSSPYISDYISLTEEGFYLSFAAMVFLLLLMSAFTIAMQIYCIYNLFNNCHVPRKNHLVWLVVLIIFGTISIPVYWFVNIFRHRNDFYEHPEQFKPTT